LSRIIYDPSAEENTNNVNVSSFHLIDAFRFVNPVEENAFTCWCTKLNARSTNYGTRIDYILVDLRLGGEMDDCVLMKDVLGSDHCPVKAIIDLKFVRAPKCPSFCTKYYPEFAGTQKKLFEFFNQKLSDHELCTSATVGSTDDLAVAYGKRKVLDTKVKSKRPKSDTKKQVGILNFFQPSETKTGDSCGSGDLDDQGSGNRSSLESSSSLSSLSEVSPDSFECTSFEQPAVLDPWNSGDLAEETLSVAMFNESEAQLSSCTAPGAEKTSSSAAWKSILTGPKCPPKCRGHREPCVQRCVKKKGPNFNRKFWVCARGEGRSSDPSARCDYFLWDSNR
jgi:Exonuclease III